MSNWNCSCFISGSLNLESASIYRSLFAAVIVVLL
uniref:Uncharacterized protein n=1 Tax=Rhizophora mucronata TaxID=61149 RepID=A0A2P2NC08_RHIMU